MAAAAALLGSASPALADPMEPAINIVNFSNASLRSGETATLTYTVTNNNNAPTDSQSVTIKVKTPDGATCSGKCSFTQAIANGSTSGNFVATIKAGNLSPGQTKSGQIEITASVAGESTSQTVDLTITGPDQVPSVPKVSGTITNKTTGEPVSGAKVYLQDSAQTTWETATDSKGRFSFTSTTDKPILPGILSLLAEKSGWEQGTKGPTGVAGQAVTVQMTMEGPPSTATPSIAATDNPLPSDEASAEPGAGDISNASAPGNDEGGGLSWVLIAIGGVLVLLGIGAIVLLFMRRKGDDAEEEHDGTAIKPRGGRPGGPPPRVGNPRPGPGGPRRANAAEPTSVMRRPEPVGARNDATMITRSPLADMPRSPMGAPGPGLADAPTMMHGRVPTDQNDPYASPVRPAQGGQGGYGAQAPGGYPQSQQGYGQGGPQQPGYGAPAGGYGRPGYGDQSGGAPTGEYSPAGGYSGGGYGSPAARPSSGGGYDQGGGYGGYQAPQQPTTPEPSYGDDSAYSRYPGGQDSYAGGQQGYRGGDAYGQQGGYDYPTQQPPAQQQPNDYGYDQYGGNQPRHGSRPPQGDRRLDWLED
ncbi:hypothetical protein GCM10009682_07430 [Luedemannella flava]|uniref:Carboxypeptidase regulatory-like domain-containing protein n=1 Tax=Luedemannella flava TaxID=349316 RepID=A0ABN2LHM7_9ACTN